MRSVHLINKLNSNIFLKLVKVLKPILTNLLFDSFSSFINPHLDHAESSQESSCDGKIPCFSIQTTLELHNSITRCNYHYKQCLNKTHRSNILFLISSISLNLLCNSWKLSSFWQVDMALLMNCRQSYAYKWWNIVEDPTIEL